MKRGGFGSRGGAGVESDGKFGNGNSGGFEGDSNGCGRGWRGGRGGRGRGRGRGFYEDRGFGNENSRENENQSHSGDGSEERNEVQNKSYGSRYETGKFGEEARNLDWEERAYSGDGRGFRGGEHQGGRGYGGRGFRGGEGRRYGGRDETWSGPENKEAPADGTEQAATNAPSGDGASGCIWERGDEQKTKTYGKGVMSKKPKRF